MNNNNDTYTVELNKEVALVSLNRTWQYPGRVTVIYYYNDNNEVDFLLSIGKRSGFGPDYYSIVQSHEEILVVSIKDDLTDVSQLVYDQKVLCFCNPDNRYSEPRWYMITDTIESDNEYTRNFTELTEPAIYRNLDDGFRWFFVDGILKREDDFLNSEQVLQLIKENIGSFKKSKLEIKFYNLPEGTNSSGSSYYLPMVPFIDKPVFSIKVFDYTGVDKTDEYTISMGDGTRLEYDSETERYTIMKRYISDSKITIKADSDSINTSETISFWFPEISYYGTCNTDRTNLQVDSKLIYNNLTSLNLTFNLNNNLSILIIPQRFEMFNHIYDTNGLDYIYDYEYISDYDYLGTMYSAYIKYDPVVISEFKQNFTYASKQSSAKGGSSNIDEEDTSKYYTRDEIDNIIYTNTNQNTYWDGTSWVNMDGSPINPYSITYNLTHIVSENAEEIIYSNRTYLTKLIPEDTYSLDSSSVHITMGGIEVTGFVYDESTNVIYIPLVTGNIIIEATGE